MSSSIYLLTGPTAVGKTELCLRLAEELEAEILSCDSMQVYKGMDIGTAKPTTAELASVRHHCIGIFPFNHTINIHTYTEVAAEAVDKITRRGKAVLVTGGSGFYLNSFIQPVCDEVKVSHEIRAEVNQLQDSGGLHALVENLRSLNPNGLGDLDIQNPRRVVRALERCKASGKTVLELRAEMEAMPEPFPDFNKRICVLNRGDNALRERIQLRTSSMLANGLVDEVRGLLSRGLLENPTAAASIGYREVIAYIQNKPQPEKHLEESINRSTWQLVRKQKKMVQVTIALCSEARLRSLPCSKCRRFIWLTGGD